MKLPACLLGLALLLPAVTTAQNAGQSPESFEGYLRVFRAALVGPDFAALADRTRLPFLLEGEALERHAFMAKAPTLFDAKVRRCLLRARPMREGDAMVLACRPYAFYFRRGQDGRYRLEEFNGDGEALR